MDYVTFLILMGRNGRVPMSVRSFPHFTRSHALQDFDWLRKRCDRQLPACWAKYQTGNTLRSEIELVFHPTSWKLWLLWRHLHDVKKGPRPADTSLPHRHVVTLKQVRKVLWTRKALACLLALLGLGKPRLCINIHHTLHRASCCRRLLRCSCTFNEDCTLHYSHRRR